MNNDKIKLLKKLKIPIKIEKNNGSITLNKKLSSEYKLIYEIRDNNNNIIHHIMINIITKNIGNNVIRTNDKKADLVQIFDKDKSNAIIAISDLYINIDNDKDNNININTNNEINSNPYALYIAKSLDDALKLLANDNIININKIKADTELLMPSIIGNNNFIGDKLNRYILSSDNTTNFDAAKARTDANILSIINNAIISERFNYKEFTHCNDFLELKERMEEYKLSNNITLWDKIKDNKLYSFTDYEMKVANNLKEYLEEVIHSKIEAARQLYIEEFYNNKKSITKEDIKSINDKFKDIYDKSNKHISNILKIYNNNKSELNKLENSLFGKNNNNNIDNLLNNNRLNNTVLFHTILSEYMSAMANGYDLDNINDNKNITKNILGKIKTIKSKIKNNKTIFIEKGNNSFHRSLSNLLLNTNIPPIYDNETGRFILKGRLSYSEEEYIRKRNKKIIDEENIIIPALIIRQNDMGR